MTNPPIPKLFSMFIKKNEEALRDMPPVELANEIVLEETPDVFETEQPERAENPSATETVESVPEEPLQLETQPPDTHEDMQDTATAGTAAVETVIKLVRRSVLMKLFPVISPPFQSKAPMPLFHLTLLVHSLPKG